jgi:hypothetical protein
MPQKAAKEKMHINPLLNNLSEIQREKDTLEANRQEELNLKSWLNQFGGLGDKIHWQDQVFEEFKDG